mmetsp:Transcript_58588/g.124327  ORF Transcript_58588/g.124327 Transcript_58588/m.124327 type:complete len:315 (+) Transcript_58588:778-1722(+)
MGAPPPTIESYLLTLRALKMVIFLAELLRLIVSKLDTSRARIFRTSAPSIAMISSPTWTFPSSTLLSCTTCTRTGPDVVGLTRVRQTFPGGATTSTSCSESASSTRSFTRREEGESFKPECDDSVLFFFCGDKDVLPASSSPSLSSLLPLETVTIFPGLLHTSAEDLNTSAALISLTSSSSSPTILPPVKIFPTSTPSPCSLRVVWDSSGLARTTPTFPARARASSWFSEPEPEDPLYVVGERNGEEKDVILSLPSSASLRSSSRIITAPSGAFLKTVIVLSGCRLFCAKILLTSTALILRTSSSSRAMILSPN